MIHTEIETLIKRALSDIGLPPEGFVVERPEAAEHGDYATNAALVCAQKAGKNPQELAEELKAAIEARGGALVARAEVAGPGFVNLFLEPAVFARAVQTTAEKGEEYGGSDALKGKKVMVEYTQPNPFKPFHIGHLMSNSIGESISRVVGANGANVIRANYQGDIGLHVAKAIWGIKQKGYSAENADELGQAYAHGHEMYEADEKAQEKIIEINKHLYAHDSEEITSTYRAGRAASLEHFEEIYKILGTQFDRYYFESETAGVGKKLVQDNIGTIFEESEGAIIFPGEKYGLHNRVFITSEGLPTYEAKDLGLAKMKMDEYAPDISITVTAVEQKEYFNVVFKAFGMLFPEYENVFQHVPHGMMELPGGKMSSRKGNVVTGELLIEDARQKAHERMQNEALKSDETLVENIAIAALKYPILKQSLGKNITFELDKALSFEGDSGPYLQYTHARIKSIMRKAEAEPSFDDPEEPGELERLIAAFPEAVSRAYEERAPNKVATYLSELAQAFNTYYAEKKIADHPYRLALAEAAAQTLKNGLHLLGIEAPEQM